MMFYSSHYLKSSPSPPSLARFTAERGEENEGGKQKKKKDAERAGAREEEVRHSEIQSGRASSQQFVIVIVLDEALNSSLCTCF